MLDQMEYLVDEVEAQRAVVGLIPSAIWDARPPGDEKTLREMYAAMVERELHANRSSFGLDGLPRTEEEQSPEALLTELAVARAALVRALRKGPVADLDAGTCYRIVQEDTDSLREIGLRLNETSIGQPRVAQK